MDKLLSHVILSFYLIWKQIHKHFEENPALNQYSNSRSH